MGHGAGGEIQGFSLKGEDGDTKLRHYYDIYKFSCVRCTLHVGTADSTKPGTTAMICPAQQP